MNRCRQRHIRAGNRHKCVVACGRLHGQKSKAHTGGRENNAFPYFLAEMKIRRRGKERCAPPASIAGGVGTRGSACRHRRSPHRSRDKTEQRNAGRTHGSGNGTRRLPVKRRQKKDAGKGKHLRHKLAAAQPKPYSRADARPRLLGTLSVYTCDPVSSRTAPMFFEKFFARICSRFQAALD